MGGGREHEGGHWGEPEDINLTPRPKRTDIKEAEPKEEIGTAGVTDGVPDEEEPGSIPSIFPTEHGGPFDFETSEEGKEGTK